MSRLPLFTLLAVALLSGCDSLHARMVAQDGVRAYRAGQLAEAAEKFERAAALDGSIAPIQLNLGFANLALYQAAPRSPAGRVAADKALLAFQRYLQLRPGEERAKVFLLQTFIDTGRYDQAVAYFKPLVDKTPPDADALTTLGVIAARTGHYEEARGWYERRIAVEPDNPEPRLSLGILLWDRLHATPELPAVERIAMADQAIAHLAVAIARRPRAPMAYTYTNLVYRERALAAQNDDEKRKDLEEAARFHQKAAALGKEGR